MTDYTVAGVCYNKYEADLVRKLNNAINDWGKEKNIRCSWYIADDDNPAPAMLKRVPGRVRDWTQEQFKSADVLIYICYAVRAVRYIGKLLTDQMSDPAVLAIDPRGKQCIPLLSGRRGEAYELARLFDSMLGIEFVNPVFPEDPSQFDIQKYAETYDMVLSNTDYAKEVSTAIGAGDEVGFYTNYPVLGSLPGGFNWASEGRLGVYVSPSYHSAYFGHTLWLIPKCLVIGVECDPDISYAKFSRFIEDTLKRFSLYPEAIVKLAILDSMVYSEAVRNYCFERDVVVTAYSKEQLAVIKGPNGEELELSECAALKGSEGKLLDDAIHQDGISCAIAMKNIYIQF